MLHKCFGLVFSGKNSQENLFLTRKVGKNIVCYSALKKEMYGFILENATTAPGFGQGA